MKLEYIPAMEAEALKRKRSYRDGNNEEDSKDCEKNK